MKVMGLPIRELHLTCTGNETGKILLSKWIPIKEGPGKYKIPPETPMGYDIWVPNLVGLTEDMGTVKVELIESEEKLESGLCVSMTILVMKTIYSLIKSLNGY